MMFLYFAAGMALGYVLAMLTQTPREPMPGSHQRAIERHLKSIVDAGEADAVNVLRDIEVSASVARQVVQSRQDFSK